MTPAAALVMSGGQREALEVIAKSRTAPFRQVQRARVLLLAADVASPYWSSEDATYENYEKHIGVTSGTRRDPQPTR